MQIPEYLARNPYHIEPNILMRLLKSVELSLAQYTDLMSTLYFASALVLVAMGFLFLSFKATKNFDQRLLLSAHWFCLAIFYVGALLALQKYSNNLFPIPSTLTSFFSQGGHYLSIVFFSMGLWEVFQNYRFSKKQIWITVVSVAVFAAGLQLVFLEMDTETRFFYKVVPPAVAMGVGYIVLGLYFCPCMNNRFKSKQKFLPSYTLNIPIIFYGISQLVLATLFADSNSSYSLRYNSAFLLVSLQVGLKVLMGVGLLKLALLMEAQNSARVEGLVSKNKDYALVGQLSAGFVHDINNSVSVMSLSTDLANKELKKGNNEKAVSYLGMMGSCSKKITELAKQISDVIRSHQGDRSQHIAFNPNETIQILHPALLILLPSNIQLKLDLDTSSQKSIFSSTTEFEMVLLNLVKNSAAAIDSRGQFLGDGLIVIRSQRIRMESAPSLGAGYGEVEAISIVVEDNGCGIPAHQLDKVGEFGFSTKGENGTGIGLANVSRFAEEHGGKFYIRSSEGKGTQVEIQIPLKDEARVDHVIVVADQPDIAREARAEEWKVLALSPASFEQVRLTSSGGVLILDSMDDRLIDVASKKFSECPRPSLWRVLRVVDDTSLAIEGWAHLGIPMADLHRRHTALELKLAIRNLLDLGKFNTVMDATMEPS